MSKEKQINCLDQDFIEKTARELLIMAKTYCATVVNRNNKNDQTYKILEKKVAAAIRYKFNKSNLYGEEKELSIFDETIVMALNEMGKDASYSEVYSLLLQIRQHVVCNIEKTDFKDGRARDFSSELLCIYIDLINTKKAKAGNEEKRGCLPLRKVEEILNQVLYDYGMIKSGAIVCAYPNYIGGEKAMDMQADDWLDVHEKAVDNMDRRDGRSHYEEGLSVKNVSYKKHKMFLSVFSIFRENNRSVEGQSKIISAVRDDKKEDAIAEVQKRLNELLQKSEYFKNCSIEIIAIGDSTAANKANAVLATRKARNVIKLSKADNNYYPVLAFTRSRPYTLFVLLWNRQENRIVDQRVIDTKDTPYQEIRDDLLEYVAQIDCVCYDLVTGISDEEAKNLLKVDIQDHILRKNVRIYELDE